MDDQFDLLTDDNLWNILENISKEIEEIPKELNKIQICTECKSENIIYTANRESYICNECGCEGIEILDDSPEWSNYEDKKADNRCGGPTSVFFPKSSLGTTINMPGYSKIKMLRNWGQVPYRERSKAEVLNDIENRCRKNNITKAVIDNAKILYNTIREIKHDTGINIGKNVIIRGINRKQIIAACFYFGAVLQRIPRSTEEVADIFNLDIKQITRGCRKFLEIMKDNFIIFDIKPAYGYDFVDRFGSKIKLSKGAIDLAKTIADNTTKLDIASDHQSMSIAAASILLSVNILKEDINRKTIAKAFGISDVTIIKTYKKLIPYNNVIIDNKITNKLIHKINFKLMSNRLENENICENKIETEVEIESETDILIKKLNQNQEQIVINQDDSDTIEDLDESDIIKKDNNLSKKNKLLLLQEEKHKKKLLRDKLKLEKIQLKLTKKESLQIESIDSIIVKKKRGRPKKI
jgi:transcription initiation factor TFIIIB Brf1 subunit/transcription initiation factor TFIIB